MLMQCVIWSIKTSLGVVAHVALQQRTGRLEIFEQRWNLWSRETSIKTLYLSCMHVRLERAKRERGKKEQNFTITFFVQLERARNANF